MTSKYLLSSHIYNNMSASPYLSDSLRSYLAEHRLQPILHETLNDLIRNSPPDPFSSLMQAFSQRAKQDIQIVSLSAIQLTTFELQPQLQLYVTARYQQKDRTLKLCHYMSQANQELVYLLDEDRCGGKGLHKACEFINEKISPLLAGQSCSEQKELDGKLSKLFESQGKGLSQITLCSLLPFFLKEMIVFRPLSQLFQQALSEKSSVWHPPQAFNLMLNALQGSKLTSSKCKVWRYYFMAEQLEDVFLVQQVFAALRKSITAGKAGEAALKYFGDGTFLCPADTINDNLKLVQQAISSSGAKDKVTIGLSWQADLFYNPDSKKFQLENPKQPFDIDQLIDYYYKLCNDKPIITYLEDPVPSQDLAAWNKLMNKFSTTNIKIGSRKIYSTEESIRKFAYPADHQTHPGLSQEELTDLNSKRVVLQYAQLKPFEKPTFSKLASHLKMLTDKKMKPVLSENHVETMDSTLVDLSAALPTSVLNLGPLVKPERLAKLTRMQELIKRKSS